MVVKENENVLEEIKSGKGWKQIKHERKRREKKRRGKNRLREVGKIIETVKERKKRD